MPNVQTLKPLIASLQKATQGEGLTEEIVEAAVDSLSKLRSYDHEKFPTLVDTNKFIDTSTDTPANLAEALLWKLGKWKVYKKFASNYALEDSSATKTDVVLFAFAKHLKDKDNPIYDQHAIRALWAICGNFTKDERDRCKSLLFDGKGEWKVTGSGGDTIECYKLFLKHMTKLVAAKGAASSGEIDRLLMPLGQAIKKATASYKEFCALCRWPSEG